MEWSGPPALVGSVRGHRGEVACLDACGARLATGCGRGVLCVWAWAPAAGWQLATERRAAHRYGVTAARWAPAGALLASAGVDGAARLWSRALTARATLAAPSAAAARALAWAAAGRLLVGHDDGAVCVWHVPRAALLVRLLAHEGAIYALTAASRGALLVTACTNGVLKVYDLIDLCRDGGGDEDEEESAAGAPRSPAPLVWEDGAHDLGALCADAGCGGALVATGGHDARVRLWRAARHSLRPERSLEGHTAAVTAVRWARAAPVLVSASLDRTARLWDTDSVTCLHVVSAHPRYLTCVAIADDLRYMVTGSNDKTFRMWALGKFSIDDELEPPCTPLSHFAIGDLEGIGPVAETGEVSSGAGAVSNVEEDGGCECICSVQAHAGAINCIATHDDLIATASSDGTVKVWRWCGERLLEEHTLEAHLYPALAVDFVAGGTLLLTAGLDGCAFIWDVQSGVQVRSLSVPGGGAGGGEAGGGGVRAARASPRPPYDLLLATDDGLAPLFALTSTDPDPQIVYAGHCEAVTCCAWSGDGRVAATGAASGELRLLAPPHPAHLHHEAHAHDLGVLSCDFAPSSEELYLPEDHYLLATAGCDSLIKLWSVILMEGVSGISVEVRLVRGVAAHGAGVCCVRWGRGALLVSAGADRWARVWRVAGAGAGAVGVAAAGAVEARGAGGALAAAPVAGGAALALATMAGELALYRMRAPPRAAHRHCTPPLYWREPDVAHWIRDYILDIPGSSVAKDEGALLLSKAQEAGVTGERLMYDPIEELLCKLGFAQDISQEENEAELEADDVEVGATEALALAATLAARLRDEIEWLRRDEHSAFVESNAPHRLRCPVTHRVLREPCCAADGFTYERDSFAEWLLAAPPEGGVSPVTGSRLATARLVPNYALRDELRHYVQQHSETTQHH